MIWDILITIDAEEKIYRGHSSQRPNVIICESSYEIEVNAPKKLCACVTFVF